MMLLKTFQLSSCGLTRIQVPGTDNMQKCESVIGLLSTTYRTKRRCLFSLHSPTKT